MKEDITKIINTIKILGIDMIDNAKSGNPGITLGAAPIMYTLYANHININPSDPTWYNRDRFVMSSAHGSALLYATLYLAGYNIKLEDLTKYRRLNSNMPGYPELNKTSGVDYTTGPLGEGLAAAVGMAMAEKYLASTLNNIVKKQRLINHNIYCLVSDGDLETGLSLEAASLAGQYNLGNLIVLYDSNDMTQDGEMTKSNKENILKRFDACGWQTDFVSDGTSIDKINKAIKRAKRVANKPSIIEIKTIIGKDSFNQGTNIVHDKPLSLDDMKNLRTTLKINSNKFEVMKSTVDKFRNLIHKRCDKNYQLWQEYYTEFKKTNIKEVQNFVNFIENKDLGFDFNANNFKIQATYEEELRESNSKIMNIIASKTPFFLGGSSDLFSACKTYLSRESDFTSKSYYGKNIYFGVREHAMGNIINGMATYGLIPFGSTFLKYFDYQKDALVSAAIMNIPVVYIYTHDGVAISEDGPISSSFEQLTTLRSIPNLLILRPGDINEVIGSWDVIINQKRPTALIISKENIHILGGTKSNQVSKGAYIVRKEKNKLDGIIITSGLELTTSLIIAEELSNEYDLRVVSCVSQELFQETDDAYKQEVLKGSDKIIAIEASNSMSWLRYTSEDKIIGINKFSTSGHPKEVLKALDFDTDTIKERIINILKK